MSKRRRLAPELKGLIVPKLLTVPGRHGEVAERFRDAAGVCLAVRAREPSDDHCPERLVHAQLALVVHDLGAVYGQVGPGVLVPVLLFGLLWGLGSMRLGMSFAFIGRSLAYALNYGAQIIFGSMMPLLLLDADQVPTPRGAVILAGVAVCLAGVGVAGRAGILKQRSLESPAGEPAAAEAIGKQPKMLVGVLLGVVSGILCACYAVASAYAAPIGALAAEHNPPWAAACAVTAMILWGGAVSSCLCCPASTARCS
jgi:L-rhamnose-H+ transport protein